MTTHASRQAYWDEALNGQIQVLDYEATNYTGFLSLRSAAYREASARGLQLASAVFDGRHLLVAAYGGPLGGWKTSPTDFRRVSDMFTGDPDRDVTVRLEPAPVSESQDGSQEPSSKLLIPFPDLPPIAPGDELFANPGAFWVGRVWEPATTWVNPFKDQPVGPQQCIWFPEAFWEQQDLVWLQKRRAAGELMPQELRQGHCPPGTAYAANVAVTIRNPVWEPDDWWDLASERFYCTCELRETNGLVDPSNNRVHADDCAYHPAPMPDEPGEQAKMRRLLDPRALRVDALMAQAKVTVLAWEREKKSKGLA